jgi:protein NEDD1
MEVFSPLVDVQPITPSISSFWDRETSGIESAGENTAVGGDSSSRRSTFGSPASAALRRFPSIEDMEKEQRRLSLGSSQVIGLLNAALFFFVVKVTVCLC